MVDQSQYYKEVMQSLFYDLAVELSLHNGNDTRDRYGSYKLKKNTSPKH